MTMKEQIKEKLKRLVEVNIYGQEGITKKIAQLTKEIEVLKAQRSEINAQINLKTKELKSYESGEISPNQTTLF
jgi:uncharacterized small protein (DUF1192 family)